MNAKYQRVAALAIFVLVFWNNAFSQSEVGRSDGTSRSSSARSSILKDIPVSSTLDTTIVRYPGFIGEFVPYTGTIYGGWGWPSGDSLQSAFKFGIIGVENSPNADGYSFQRSVVNSCTIWNTNKVYGVIEPPRSNGSGGVINQPADTSLFEPFANLPGMIQGAHRFSELSKIYPQISGIIIDDFGGAFLNGWITPAQLQEIREALQGKGLDANGNIVDTSQATTPDLKLYIVYYRGQSLGQSLNNSIDGMELWMPDQNASYTNLNGYVDSVKQAYPGKGIIVGVYINSGVVSTPESIRYMIRNSIDLYDQGEINGVSLFTGQWLIQQMITQARWDSLAIPPMLDSLYYPYLGEVTGKVVDGSGNPISHARVTVNRLTGTKTQLVTRRITSSIGQFSFGGWASNNGSLYQVEVAKPPYRPNKFEVKLQPGVRVLLPDVMMTQ